MSPGTLETDALGRFIAAARGRPFAWGQRDCVLFVADWLRFATGQDFAAGVRGTYACEAGGKAVLGRLGGFVGLARRARLKPAADPVRGDVGIIAGRPDVLGVCLGGGPWVFQGREGLAMVSRPQIRRAWACPRR